ncbi:hypothetical protein NQ315_007575 [Exocentrus adspersus]|uniref:Secreted protein n=1 Tax=Exocentrus adspersus TaxID=1586481 RepID=A0AAV8W823_9CUCU|nr:hypothetical protein NQ315_007575 [Exocentrus adspersus]
MYIHYLLCLTMFLSTGLYSASTSETNSKLLNSLKTTESQITVQRISQLRKWRGNLDTRYLNPTIANAGIVIKHQIKKRNLITIPPNIKNKNACPLGMIQFGRSKRCTCIRRKPCVLKSNSGDTDFGSSSNE